MTKIRFMLSTRGNPVSSDLANSQAASRGDTSHDIRAGPGCADVMIYPNRPPHFAGSTDRNHPRHAAIMGRIRGFAPARRSLRID